MDVEVVHRPDSARFVAEVQGQLAVLTYDRGDGEVVFTHTVVPPELQGQGVAGQLAQTAVGWAREEGLRVVPQCSYVQGWLERNPG